MPKSFSYLLTAMLLLTNLLLLSCQKDKPLDQPNPGTNTNALLVNPQKGNPITTGTIDNFTFVSKDTNVVLIIGNNASGKLYAIDIKDNDATQATPNAIANTPGFKAKIAQFMGITNLNQITIMNMEVNPISKAVYVLVKNNTSNTAGLFKVIGGTTIVPVNLSNVSYAAITFSTNNSMVLQDMTWGENELYVSIGNWRLNAEVGKISIPFTHNSSLTKKNTTVFTHGSYSTNAPLEKMVYGKVKGEARLMGVTTCAPGYSFKTSALNITGALDVKEYFELMGGQPQKVISVTQGTSTYLVELHSEPPFLVRIGEKFIDETKPSNDNSTKLFSLDMVTSSKVRTTGLTDNDIKIYTDVCYVMAKYNETQVLVVDNMDNLKLVTL